MAVKLLCTFYMLQIRLYFYQGSDTGLLTTVFERLFYTVYSLIEPFENKLVANAIGSTPEQPTSIPGCMHTIANSHHRKI
jgi:hypothetical protein